MPKRSSTVEHARREGVEHIPKAVAEHPTYIRRLNWKFGDRVPMDTVQVVRSISESPDEAVWFIDNNVLAEDVDDAISEALLEKPGRMVLTPLVMAESRDWLTRHPGHVFVKAIKNGTAKPAEWKLPAVGEPGRDVYEYYLALLRLRRYNVPAAEDRFQREHGRPPTRPSAPRYMPVFRRTWACAACEASSCSSWTSARWIAARICVSETGSTRLRSAAYSSWNRRADSGSSTPSSGDRSPCSVVLIAAPFGTDMHGRSESQDHVLRKYGDPVASKARSSVLQAGAGVPAPVSAAIWFWAAGRVARSATKIKSIRSDRRGSAYDLIIRGGRAR
jgi:hypothetical protein